MIFLNEIAQITFNFVSMPITIMDAITDLIPKQPPLSSVFILIVAFLVALFSTLVSRLMIDTDKLARLTRESKKYNELRKQMMKTADSKLKLKYERNSDRMRKVQSELTMMNMKPLAITFIPLIIVFGLMASIYTWTFSDVTQTLTGGIPAVIPFTLPETIPLLEWFPLARFGENVTLPGWGKVFLPYYLWWYFGGSIVFSSILRKITGLQPDV